MRVLLISHTCQTVEGQPKAWQLAQFSDVELCVLTPDRWFLYGEWKFAAPPQNAPFRFEVGKTLWSWSRKGQWYLHWYPQMARLLREFQPDIIDLWEEPWGLVSAQTCYLRERIIPRAKIISETEQNILKTLPPPFENFRSYTLKRADFCVARNREAQQVLRAKGFAGTVRIVPNAVDAQSFRPLDKESCRRKYELSGFVVGYVGRIIEEKGVMDLLKSLQFCHAEVNLLIVGSGDFRATLESRARELGLSTRLRFAGAVAADELPILMNAMDVLALPSRTTPRWKEQFGRVIIEAHACQTPVIGSSSGAIPDVVGKGGIVFPEGESWALAEAVETLRNDEARRLQMGEIGRRQVEENYTWQRVAEKMHAIYSELNHR